MNLLLLLLIIIILFLFVNFFKYKVSFCLSLFLVLIFYYIVFSPLIKPYYETIEPDDGNLVDLNYITQALRNYRLYICDIKDTPTINAQNRQEKQYLDTRDLSIYKNKIYLYFGITPVILFHLPFNLITNLYLSMIFVNILLIFFIFLLSVLLFEKMMSFLEINIKTYGIKIIRVLSIFLLAIGPQLFHIMRGVYLEEILTALFLILMAFYILLLYFTEKNISLKKYFLFFMSVVLALSVGARPQNIFLIPFFLIILIHDEYCLSKNIKKIIETGVIFLIPCILYGSLLGLYNYLRFDSIFEFGYIYMPVHNQKLYPDIKEIFNGIIYSFFTFPQINLQTIFQLNYHIHPRVNCGITGIIYLQPMVLFLLLVPFFICLNRNIKYIYLCVLWLIDFLSNSIITNFSAISSRYIIEYSIIMQIFALAIFIKLYEQIKTKTVKCLVIISFIIILVYSIFINIAIMFNVYNVDIPISIDKINNLIDFLFK